MYQYGFIGAGNMTTALASGLVQKIAPKDVVISNRTAVKAETLSERLGCDYGTNEIVAKSSNYVVLGVKPQLLEEVLTPLQDVLKENGTPVLVTMAAGTKMSTICDYAGGEYPVIRIMPNTPCSVGAGVILVAHNDLVTEEQLNAFLDDFAACGMLCPLEEESLIDAGSVISGCGPAYIYMYMDAMAKAGVKLGLDYDTAAALAKATARGAALLSETSEESLESLRVAVCSPGGSTIEGVKSFWESDLDQVVDKALTCAFNRTKELAGDA